MLDRQKLSRGDNEKIVLTTNVLLSDEYPEAILYRVTKYQHQLNIKVDMGVCANIYTGKSENVNLFYEHKLGPVNDLICNTFMEFTRLTNRKIKTYRQI